jgi:hypothetical protein
MEEPKTITYLINLAIDTKEIQKKTVTIHFKEHSIEEYLQWKNYLQNESLENKLKYLETISVNTYKIIQVIIMQTRINCIP